MATKIIKLEHNSTETTSTYGGTVTTAKYDLRTECDGIQNSYELKAEIRGIASGDPHMHLLEYKALTNNENTLTQEAICDLLDW